MGLLLPRAVDSCGEPPSAVCEWVYDRTGNSALAGASDWFIGRPLKILAILVVAWLITLLARRFVRRTTRRLAASEGLASLGALNGGRRSAAEPTSDRDGAVVREPRRIARAQSIGGVLSSALSVIVWVTAAVMIIGQLGIDLAPLIAGAGIAGIAIGFGAQSLVRDCLAGFFMVVEDQFGLGDIVDLGSADGTVERFTLRTTVVRGQNGTLWHVPNGEIKRVGNLSQVWSVAVLDVVVPNGLSLDEAKVAITEAASATCAEEPFASTMLEPPRLLGVEQVSDEGVSLRLVAKTSPGSQFAVQRAMREAIKRRLDEMAPGSDRNNT